MEDKRSLSSKLLVVYSQLCQNPCNNANSILSLFTLILQDLDHQLKSHVGIIKPCAIISSVFSPNDKLVSPMALALFVK